MATGILNRDANRVSLRLLGLLKAAAVLPQILSRLVRAELHLYAFRAHITLISQYRSKLELRGV